jgi:hypothetical protein
MAKARHWADLTPKQFLRRMKDRGTSPCWNWRRRLLEGRGLYPSEDAKGGYVIDGTVYDFFRALPREQKRDAFLWLRLRGVISVTTPSPEESRGKDVAYRAWKNPSGIFNDCEAYKAEKAAKRRK